MSRDLDHRRVNEAELAVMVELIAAFFRDLGRDPTQIETDALLIQARALAAAHADRFRLCMPALEVDQAARSA